MMLAKSFLFVPADRLDRLPKAVATGVGAVIIDLEDAVVGADKASLRQTLLAQLQAWDYQAFGQIWLRINAVSTDEFADDVALLGQLPHLSGVLLPKVAYAHEVQTLANHTDKPIIAMIESATGLLNIADIAKVQGLTALSYGVLDFLVSMGVKVDSTAGRLMCDKIRTELVLHSCANGLNPPIETIYPDFHDEAGLVACIRHWQAFGFGGQLLIHPKQVATLLATQKHDDELSFAKKVLDHHDTTGEAIFAIDGQMVDLPVITWAKAQLNRYG